MPPKLSRRAGKTWDRLRQWYGARLTDQYGDVPPPDWADVIDRTDDERLDQALVAVRRASPAHPPTLGQLEAALPKRNERGAPSLPDRLHAHAITAFRLCVHQIMRPCFFGSEIDSGGHKLPIIKGVMYRSCAECANPSQRLLADDLVGTGVAA